MKKNMLDLLKQINNIPNMLSVFRIVLIPFYVIAYFKENYWLAVILLFLSGVSDLVDGFVARHFNQITDLGKALDPLADKLTQMAIMVCAAAKNIIMMSLLVIVVAKEVLMITFNFYMFKKGEKPIAAKWYGKLATAVFYIGMGILLLFDAINITVPSFVLITIAVLIAVTCANALVRYFLFYKQLTAHKEA